ncbi:MAG: tetratricopeptide repeat protein [Candidatus Omnitrophica bacterium]|nr:tetratricopeptide repeat protein [Candidatus Omnitrophota bacterium]
MRRVNIVPVIILSAIILSITRAACSAETAEDTKRFYEKVVKMQPGNGNAHFDLANAYLSEKRYEDALAHYEKAGHIGLAASRMGSYYFNIAVCYAGLGKMDDAVRSLEKCLKIDPGNSETKSLLAIYKNK